MTGVLPLARQWRPAVILFCAITHASLFGVIVPHFADVYESVDIELPCATVLIVTLGKIAWRMSPILVLATWVAIRIAQRRNYVAEAIYAVSLVVWLYAAMALYLPNILVSQSIGKNH